MNDQKTENKQTLTFIFLKATGKVSIQSRVFKMEEKLIMKECIVGDLHGTALFLDIKNFLGITEILTPKETYMFIQTIIEPLSICVQKYRGYICQVQGDALFVFFGHNVEEREHASDAVHCALELQKIIYTINPVLINKYKVPLSACIGICSGDMYASHIDILGKKEYTVFGKSINIASRLQKINRQYGTNILIDESVYGYIKRDVSMRSLDVVNINGCSELICIYEVLSSRKVYHTKTVQSKECYEKGLTSYLQGEWDEALKWFSRVAESKASYLMIERCKKQKAALNNNKKAEPQDK